MGVNSVEDYDYARRTMVAVCTDVKLVYPIQLAMDGMVFHV